ncbi:MAG TPA: hypothetical protein VH914_04605 [Acidimicrobiia bacterium]|jgi:hypothetical protein|nr:hypothetical protein [Acidimicrobiia bacterium]
MGIAPGEEWGEPCADAPALTVEGDDGDLASAVRDAPIGALVRFVPAATSDLARALGLRAGAEPRGVALPLDALDLGDGTLAVNAIVLGVPPDRLTALGRARPLTLALDGHDADAAVSRATTIVVANGQWLRGCDLVPRGHPGDGRAEVQAYRLRPGERAAMRSRLSTGTHLPHSRIVTRTARAVTVRTPRPWPFEVDGRLREPVTELHATVVPARFRLLV